MCASSMNVIILHCTHIASTPHGLHTIEHVLKIETMTIALHTYGVQSVGKNMPKNCNSEKVPKKRLNNCNSKSSTTTQQKKIYIYIRPKKKIIPKHLNDAFGRIAIQQTPQRPIEQLVFKRRFFFGGVG